MPWVSAMCGPIRGVAGSPRSRFANIASFTSCQPSVVLTIVPSAVNSMSPSALPKFFANTGRRPLPDGHLRSFGLTHFANSRVRNLQPTHLTQMIGGHVVRPVRQADQTSCRGAVPSLDPAPFVQRIAALRALRTAEVGPPQGQRPGRRDDFPALATRNGLWRSDSVRSFGRAPFFSASAASSCRAVSRVLRIASRPCSRPSARRPPAHVHGEPPHTPFGVLETRERLAPPEDAPPDSNYPLQLVHRHSLA